MRESDSLREAFEAGRRQGRVRRPVNPYLPAEPGSRRMLLAQAWQRGVLADMPRSFFTA